MSLTRVRAIVWKESMDLRNNFPMMILIFTPLLLGAIYSRMSDNSLSILPFPIIMTISMIAISFQSTSIAEEKEKHTLRNLMLSPASIVDILFGNSILTFMIVLLVSIINTYLFNISLGTVTVLLLPISLGTIFCLTIGTSIGLVVKNVAQTNTLSLPIIMLLFMGPTLAPTLNIDWFSKVITYIPTYHVQEVITKIATQETIGMYQEHLWWLLAWTIAGALLTLFLYRKGTLDSD